MVKLQKGEAQTVNVATGPVNMLLVMCGAERDLRTNVAIALGIQIVLSLVLIPRFGTIAAAAATSAGIIGLNLASAFLVHRKLSISLLP